MVLKIQLCFTGINYTLTDIHIENVSGYSRNPCSLNRERDAALTASGTPTAWPSLNPYRITPIHWLMARRHLWRNDVVRSYWQTRHPLLRFLCRKEPCRQREELGSIRSVSFPIQRTRVTRVTRDVLFHRWTQRCIDRFGNDIPNTPSWKSLLIWSNNEPTTYGRFKQTGPENLEPYQRQGCKTW